MASHQTVRLSRGAHSSPDRGVCVMELASMLAGERFSDQPRSVSPVIGSFLRTYNDRVDDDRRQDLYAYAARVVGTRAPRPVERARARLCIAWARRRGVRAPLVVRIRASAAAGAVAANLAASDASPEGHASALALLDRLIATGAGSRSSIPDDARELLAEAGEPVA